jgi:hypothetical protein
MVQYDSSLVEQNSSFFAGRNDISAIIVPGLLHTTGANHETAMNSDSTCTLMHAAAGEKVHQIQAAAMGRLTWRGACDAIPFCERSDEDGVLPF